GLRTPPVSQAAPRASDSSTIRSRGAAKLPRAARASSRLRSARAAMAATATKASQALPERSRPPAAMTASTEATRTPVPTHDRTSSLSARSCSSSSPLVDVGAAHARPPVAERLHADRLHRDVMGVRRELLDELAFQVGGGADVGIDEGKGGVPDVLHLELALAGHAPLGQAQAQAR